MMIASDSNGKFQFKLNSRARVQNELSRTKKKEPKMDKKEQVEKQTFLPRIIDEDEDEETFISYVNSS